MWISTRSPWSSLSPFPSLMTSSFTVSRNVSRTTRSARRYQVNQEDDAFKLRLDVPGVHLEDLTVEVKDQILHISFVPSSVEEMTSTSVNSDSQEDSSQSGRWIFNELSNQSTSYQFTLPSSVQSDQIEAELKNGQLFLTLPKSQPLIQNIKIQQGV